MKIEDGIRPTRREFLVYHVSPFLAAAGVVFSGLGFIRYQEGQKEIDRGLHNFQRQMEDVCGHIPSYFSLTKEDCLEAQISTLNSVRPSIRTIYIRERGLDQDEKMMQLGLPVMAVGITIKLLDSFLKRRRQQQKPPVED